MVEVRAKSGHPEGEQGADDDQGVTLATTLETAKSSTCRQESRAKQTQPDRLLRTE